MDVVLDREQEALVAGELRERHFRLRVEVSVVLELAEEWLQPAVLAQVGHPKKELARVLVLRDRLERLDVLEPQPIHTGATPPGPSPG